MKENITDEEEALFLFLPSSDIFPSSPFLPLQGQFGLYADHVLMLLLPTYVSITSI